jgi:hypothetical protein
MAKGFGGWRVMAPKAWDPWKDGQNQTEALKELRGWINTVAMTPERDLRGHRIAFTYNWLAHDLYRWIYQPDRYGDRGQGVRGVSVPPLTPEYAIDAASVDANWFCVATWATVTLNRDIRNDQAPYRSQWLVPSTFRRQATSAIMSVKSTNRQLFMQLLTWYQRLVFINTTLTYVAIREWENSDPSKGLSFALRRSDGQIVLGSDLSERPDPLKQQIDTLVKGGGTGNDPLTPNRHTNQIAMAFEYYRRARRVTLAIKSEEGENEGGNREWVKYLNTVRTRLIFFGNLVLTALEQDIVHPGVVRALSNAPEGVTEMAIGRLAYWAQRMQGLPVELVSRRVQARVTKAESALSTLWVSAMTRELLILALPTETLRLGKDIPLRVLGHPYYPKELQNLQVLPELTRDSERATTVYDFEVQDPEPRGRNLYGQSWSTQDPIRDNGDLCEMVATFDLSTAEGIGTGARDWRNYAERVNWAITMIRSRIRDRSLFWPPYRIEDVERIISGKLPHFSGDPTNSDVMAPLEGFPFLYAQWGQTEQEHSGGGGG